MRQRIERKRMGWGEERDVKEEKAGELINGDEETH